MACLEIQVYPEEVSMVFMVIFLNMVNANGKSIIAILVRETVKFSTGSNVSQ